MFDSIDIYKSYMLFWFTSPADVLAFNKWQWSSQRWLKHGKKQWKTDRQKFKKTWD